MANNNTRVRELVESQLITKKMHRFLKKIEEKKIVAEEVDSNTNPGIKMAKKKGGEAISLQIEVEDEGQWRNMLRREGLIIVDVYASWAGPCVSMLNILKRVKVEVNDDRLWLAIAKSDDISDLLMFKDQCEPTWLFIGGGKPVKVVRGANAPKLINAIKSEFQHELMCMQGKARRNLISIDDEASRRKKAEAEAMRLAAFVKEEEATAEDLNELRRESSLSLMKALEPYTVLVIQNYLLATGACVEIRDNLTGDFKIEQEKMITLAEEGARNLFRIPTEIRDPNEPTQDFGYTGPDENPEDLSAAAAADDDDTVAEEETKEEEANESGAEVQSEVAENGEAVQPSSAQTTPTKKKNIKTIAIECPAEVIGETLVFLLESLEIRKIIQSGMKPPSSSPLQNADDYIRLKVGPVKYEDAVESAPYSFIAVYGQSKYVPGVWCPRNYDDKRYVMINYFPRFITEMLMPPPKTTPKYCVAVFPLEAQSDVTSQLNSYKNGILAKDKLAISHILADEMIKSWNITGDDYNVRLGALTAGDVFALSVDRRNSDMMLTVKALEPIHISYDNTYGKEESAKLFQSLEISLEDSVNPDEVVEKFLARTKPRIRSVQELVPAVEPQYVEVSKEIGEEGAEISIGGIASVAEPESSEGTKEVEQKSEESPVEQAPSSEKEEPTPAAAESEGKVESPPEESSPSPPTAVEEVKVEEEIIPPPPEEIETVPEPEAPAETNEDAEDDNEEKEA